MKSKLLIYLKGLCMGISDVIPGVSGGTMALILGIYERLIEALRGIDLSFLRSTLNVLVPDGESTWTDWLGLLRERDVYFLVILVAGAGTAIVGGSFVIPSLIADYPVSVRGFFFGLILGSVWIPYTMLRTRETKSILVSVLVLLVFLVAGFYLTGPDLRLQSSYTWTETTSQGETLREVLQRTSSARPPRWILKNPRNDELREVLLGEEKARTISENNSTDRGGEAHGSGEVEESYFSLHVPAGVDVSVPTLSLGFVFFAAFVAISAMILPGISGSYFLLILGSYFYVTFSVKSFLSGLFDGRFHAVPFLILAVFMVGLLSGLAVLTRVLSYFLRNARAATVGALTGLMLGCLRGVWPYRIVRDGVTMNEFPAALTPTVQNGILFALLGFVIVFSLSWLGSSEDSPRRTS